MTLLTGIGLGTLGGSPQGGLVTHTNTIQEIARRQPGILRGGAHGGEQTPDLGWERDGQGWERRSGHTTRRLTTHTTGHTKNKHRNKARTVMHHAATNGPKAAQRPNRIQEERNSKSRPTLSIQDAGRERLQDSHPHDRVLVRRPQEVRTEQIQWQHRLTGRNSSRAR